MSERYWAKSKSTGRTVWEYCEDRPLPYVVGYIVEKKNKHRCRDWLVYWYDREWERTYLGLLKDMRPTEAKAVAQLLIGAQQ
jgi:hypothetical protein